MKCQEENGGIFGKNHFGPWDAHIFEVDPALVLPSLAESGVRLLDMIRGISLRVLHPAEVMAKWA